MNGGFLEIENPRWSQRGSQNASQGRTTESNTTADFLTPLAHCQSYDSLVDQYYATEARTQAIQDHILEGHIDHITMPLLREGPKRNVEIVIKTGMREAVEGDIVGDIVDVVSRVKKGKWRRLMEWFGRKVGRGEGRSF